MLSSSTVAPSPGMWSYRWSNSKAWPFLLREQLATAQSAVDAAVARTEADAATEWKRV